MGDMGWTWENPLGIGPNQVFTFFFHQPFRLAVAAPAVERLFVQADLGRLTPK